MNKDYDFYIGFYGAMATAAIVFLLMSSCSSKVKEPKFLKDQKVHYKVPKFYIKVCSGVGVIEEFEQVYDIYTIYVNEYKCPSYFTMHESDIYE